MYNCFKEPNNGTSVFFVVFLASAQESCRKQFRVRGQRSFANKSISRQSVGDCSQSRGPPGRFALMGSAGKFQICPTFGFVFGVWFEYGPKTQRFVPGGTYGFPVGRNRQVQDSIRVTLQVGNFDFRIVIPYADVAVVQAMS